MKKRNFRILNCILISLILIAAVPVTVLAVKNSEISDSEQRIDENKEKIKKLEEENNKLKEEVSRLEGLKSDAAAYIAELDRRKQQLEEDIFTKEQEIAAAEENIKLLEEELVLAEAEVENQKNSMMSRIRLMYEAGHSGYLDNLVKSENFASVLNNMEYVTKVTDYDREKLEEFKLAVRVKNRKIKVLESERAVLDAGKEAIQTELESVKELSEKKDKEIKAYEAGIIEAVEKKQEIGADVSRLKAAIKEEENRIARIEAEEKRREEEARKKAEAAKKTYKAVNIGDISFTWPVPSSGKITSTFGSREAPVDGASTNHKGIDIGVSEGTEIVAAEKGTVVISTYSESAGNYVMISHGGGIYTVYMHMKKQLVSVNDEVNKGQLIGYVGSTGYSTGPHLHFGIRVNGEYVDPLLYVSK